MEITGLEQGRRDLYLAEVLLPKGVRERETGQEIWDPFYKIEDNSIKIYTRLPIAKTARSDTAERVYYICHLCSRLVLTDEARVITSGMNEDVEKCRITIEHSLCKQCKYDYSGWDELGI